MGSPAGVQDYTVLVTSGTIIGSATPTDPAMDLSGFTAGSRVRLINYGRVGGAGGAGGEGIDGYISLAAGVQFGIADHKGGGGGGGAGTVVGVGASATSTAVSGSNGGDELGGAFGANGSGSNNYVVGSLGTDGGDAVFAGIHTVAILNATGEIWGGGGGGEGGYVSRINLGVGGTVNVFILGTNGGDVGDAADGTNILAQQPPASAGYAVRGSGVIAFLDLAGSIDPQFKGAFGS